MAPLRLVRRSLLASTVALACIAGCSNEPSGDSPANPTDDGGNGDGGGCTAGTADCACKGDGACDEGLACVTGTCKPATTTGLAVSDPSVRGCEVVLTETSAKVLALKSDSTAKGTIVREAPRVGLSFVATGDAAIATGALKLQLAGAPSGISVGKTTCVDAQGHPVAGVTVSVAE